MDKRICPVCGKELQKSAHYNQKYCSAQCRTDAMKTLNRELREWRKEKGLCTVCGKEPPVKGRVLCWRCAENNKYFCKEKYEKRKKRHICHQCGKPIEEDRVVCKECVAKRGEKHKEIYKLRKMNNQCVRCGKKLVSGDNHVLCTQCLNKMANFRKKAA